MRVSRRVALLTLQILFKSALPTIVPSFRGPPRASVLRSPAEAAREIRSGKSPLPYSPRLLAFAFGPASDGERVLGA